MNQELKVKRIIHLLPPMKHFVFPCVTQTEIHQIHVQNHWIHPENWIEIAQYLLNDKSRKYSDTGKKFPAITVPYPPSYIEVTSDNIKTRCCKLLEKYKLASAFADKYFEDNQTSQKDRNEVLELFLEQDAPRRGSQATDPVVLKLLEDFRSEKNNILPLWKVQQQIAERIYQQGGLLYQGLPLEYGGSKTGSPYNRRWIHNNLQMSVGNVNDKHPDQHIIKYFQGKYIPGKQSLLSEYNLVSNTSHTVADFGDLTQQATIINTNNNKNNKRNKGKSLNREISKLPPEVRSGCTKLVVTAGTESKVFVAMNTDTIYMQTVVDRAKQHQGIKAYIAPTQKPKANGHVSTSRSSSLPPKRSPAIVIVAPSSRPKESLECPNFVAELFRQRSVNEESDDGESTQEEEYAQQDDSGDADIVFETLSTMNSSGKKPAPPPGDSLTSTALNCNYFSIS
jgi:hypothetical protein